MRSPRIQPLVFSGLFLLLFVANTPIARAQSERHTTVVKASRHVLAPPLSQTALIPPEVQLRAPLREEEEERSGARALHGAVLTADPLVQASSDAALAAALSPLTLNSGLNILGLGYGFPNYTNQANVPDTNGAVGPTQFVEWINYSFVVFNKSTGAVQYGPALGATLWQSLGGPCATYSNLDPVVQYDKLANRWVMFMPIFHEPSYFCVAVSTTSDFVNSSWHLYNFLEPTTTLCNCRPMPDYPKWGVWPDGYYVSYNQGGGSNNFLGAGACVVDRNSMLAGNAATMQCFTTTGANYGAMLPADVDGTTAPPSGSPEYYTSFDYNDQSLDIWQFHVDWTTPSNSTFTGPTNISVAAFTESCGETVTEMNYTTGACVPQLGTSEMLDSYADRLMFRLAYRNFGSYASLLANHTVNTGSGSQTGLRWYELRNSGSGFSLYQQGTYAPDASSRWMGSIAMDKVGDIAMAYSTSSSTINPTIRYTGRVPTDALGQMDSETDILSQASVAHTSLTSTYRWGDYSSLVIDSSDDCTFWSASEYIPTGANNHWATRISAFNFPSCTQSYTLTVSEIGQGTVTSADGNINCVNGSGSCSAVYSSGASVSLTATPSTNWAFSGWSGACTGANPCTVTMSSSQTATATFAATQTYTLSVNEVGQGTVTSTDGSINCTNGSGTCSAVYPSGTSVSLTGSGASGWNLSGWSGACTGGNPCVVLVNSNQTATATFTTNSVWALVNKASKSGSPLTSLTIPSTGSGHLIAVALMFNGSTTVSSIADNAGNTYVSANARSTIGSLSTEIWYAVNSKSGATTVTPTFAGSPNHVEMTTWEVSGVPASAPDAKGISSAAVTLNNTPGPAVTTTQPGDFVISILFANSTNFTAITTGNEFTNDYATFGNGWAHITSNAAAAGTHQASWYTANPVGVYCASTVAFLP